MHYYYIYLKKFNPLKNTCKRHLYKNPQKLSSTAVNNQKEIFKYAICISVNKIILNGNILLL